MTSLTVTASIRHKENQITDLKLRAYTAYCAVVFLILALTALTINLFMPGLRARRRVAGMFARGFFRTVGIRLTVEGLAGLPRTPCVVVANHGSYVDGIVAVAALPPDFAFVIKREMGSVPLAGLLLRRIGSEFVERVDVHKGASDARRVLKAAAGGQSLVFFPEGTFDEHRRINKFMGGAFATALRSRLPIVPVAILGTRDVLPSGIMTLRRHPIRVRILDTLAAEGARQRSREMLADAVGEPLAP